MPFLNMKPIKNGDSATPTLFNERFQKIVNFFNNGLDSANITDGAITSEKIAAAAVTAEKVSPAANWQTVTYQNSWTTYSTSWGPAEYYKDHAGVVHMRGLIKSGTVGATAFTLPAGYRPGVQLLFAIISNEAIARVDVKANGEVVVTNGSNNWVSLASIVFRAEA